MGSENTAKTIKTFQDLYAWEEGHKLVLAVYSVTRGFPASENFALTGQMRRAVVSVTSNVAEGFSRRSQKDKTHFYSMALGSLTELQNQIYVATDVGYLNNGKAEELKASAITVHKLINGLIKSTKT